jgi:hypothetical protein
MEKKLHYLEAQLYSTKNVKKQRNRFLIWLSALNENLPIEKRLSDTEIERIASFLAEVIRMG